ncbi:MAG TPA: hypothetical protein VER39_08980 [Nocardioidaceae bacterium]|nr:hypothetical protein [Nocardioidaceae bacterium]
MSGVRGLDAGRLIVGSRVGVSQPCRTVSAHHECTPLPNGDTWVRRKVVTGALGAVAGRPSRRLAERYLAMDALGLRSRAQ